jgi:hypothetical protein
VSKIYARPHKIVGSGDYPMTLALSAVGWKRGQKVLVEFPEGVYDNPVYEGTGRRISNPDYPERASQRYVWRGSPHDKRIPRETAGVWTVKYMAKRYNLRAESRRLESDDMVVAFVAEEME